jgi:protein TonB
MHLAAHPFRDIQLDPKRIAGISATIAAHVALFMVLFVPAQWTPPAAVADVDEPPTILPEIKREPIPPIPIDVKPKPESRPKASIPAPPVDTPRPVDTFVEKDVPIDDSNEVVIADNTFEAEPLPPAGPQDLAVLFGPPPVYPIDLIRRGIEGKVVLLIEVDASGHPTGGVIHKSSGNRLLDNAALKTVLAKWRFEPAKQGGQPIAASALVPVVFSLTD